MSAEHDFDVVLVSEANGIFTTTEATMLKGGKGKDKLTGGTGGEALTGGTGQDKVFGKGGPDSIFWKAGDGNDTIDGQGGLDTVGATGMSGLISRMACIEPARSPRLNSSLYGKPSSSHSQTNRSERRPSR